MSHISFMAITNRAWHEPHVIYDYHKQNIPNIDKIFPFKMDLKHVVPVINTMDHFYLNPVILEFNKFLHNLGFYFPLIMKVSLVSNHSVVLIRMSGTLPSMCMLVKIHVHSQS